jgi:octaprenyl-diphosphate synthase
LTIFATIHHQYQDQLTRINDILIDRAKGDSELANKIIENLVSFKGKRLRPLLVVISYHILNKNHQNDDFLKIAAAIELLHNATLLHDDVIDDSKMRRGRKTANYQWGNKAGILSGDLLLATSFQIIIEVAQMEILNSIALASKIMSNGEILQLSNIGNIKIGREKYLDIIYAKTATLFSVATESGAILANANNQEIKSLKEFGMNLGMSFQIMDDILDYDSSNDKMGKNIADDFMEGKVTLPIILLEENCTDLERESLNKIFQNNQNITEQNFYDVKLLIEKYNIIAKSKDLALEYLDKAKNNLSNFNDLEHKNTALSLLDYVVNQE